jgi:ATP/maltotriose-dependent transcriptional regulator MalT
MSGSPIPIVWAKLRPPMLPDHMVERMRLREHLWEVADAPLVAIVAPAGYGKTTAAAQLVGDSPGALVWVALEPSDDEPVRFWSYVASGLCAAGVDADLAYGHLADGPTAVDAAVTALRAAVESHHEPVTIVLDDLHVIENESVNRSLSELLRQPVDGLQIVATSRRDLALPVGRLRSHGRLGELRTDELAFDGAEAEMLLSSAFGLDDMTDAQLDALSRRTEGWPVGLYLAGLSLRDHPDIDGQVARFAGDTRHLSEYLVAEVIDDLDDDTRAFALATSIVTMLDPSLCDHLTGQPGSLAILRRLLARNVFITTIDESATMFRYHPLFRERLASTLAEEHPEILATLHSRASIWCERNGDRDGAVMHAADAGDIDRARELILASWLEFGDAGSFTSLEQWVRRLGDDARNNFAIALSMGWGMLNLNRHEEIEPWLEHAAAAADDPAGVRQVLLESSCIRGHEARHLGDVDAIVRHAGIAMANADFTATLEVDGGPTRLVGVTANTLVVAASAAYWTGDLATAEEQAEAAVALARGTGEKSTVISGYAHLALVAAEQGDLERAQAHADQALQLVETERDEQFHRPTLAHIARAMAARISGRLADAGASLDHAERIEATPRELLHLALIETERALVEHAAGNRTDARAALRRARAIVAECPSARFDDRLRRTENAIRFAAIDVAAAEGPVPIGVRELTEKELAVLALLPHGLSRRDLASQLHVSENTVKTHLTAIRHKLGVPGRGDLVARATELGLMSR